MFWSSLYRSSCVPLCVVGRLCEVVVSGRPYTTILTVCLVYVTQAHCLMIVVSGRLRTTILTVCLVCHRAALCEDRHLVVLIQRSSLCALCVTQGALCGSLYLVVLIQRSSLRALYVTQAHCSEDRCSGRPYTDPPVCLGVS